MKTLGQISLAVLAVAMIAGGMLSSFYIRKERDAITDQIQTLQTRVRDLQGCVGNMNMEIEYLAGEVAAQSNRADVAEDRCAGEKSTNEPLRRQIEQMMAERIDLESKQEHDRVALSRQTDAYKKAKSDLVVLEERNAAATKQFQDLKSLFDAALLAQDKQAAEIKVLGTKVAGLEGTVTVAKTKLGETEKLVNAGSVRIEGLTQELAAARDQSVNLGERLAQVQALADSAESKVALEAHRATTAEAQVTTHSGTIATLTKQVRDLTEKLKASDGRVTELQKQIKALTPAPAPKPTV